MLHRKLVIVGGGPVGLSLALFLSHHQEKVTIIDQGLDYNQDGRVLALSYASKKILQQINCWNEADATPIRRVQISHAGLGVSNIDAESIGLTDLGYTVSYADLCNGLMQKVLLNPKIEFLIAKVSSVEELANYAFIAMQDKDGHVQQISSDFLIMAEGGKLLGSKQKKIAHDYQQTAVVAKIQLAKPGEFIAYERFTQIGPLVLLPFKHGYTVVWALENELAEQLVANPERLTELLEQYFTRRFGVVSLNGQLSTFPLRLTQINRRVSQRIIMVGNSAQTVHPVSAQGLNLGLRDIVILNNLISKHGADIRKLAEFDKLRNKDADNVIGFTHFLASFVDKPGDFYQHLRGLGIMALSNMPFIQNKIARRLIYGS